jgi:putative ABC transport system permease protein
MRAVRRALTAILPWRRHRQLRDDVDEELRAHHEQLIARFIAAGLSPADARAAATRQLGNTTLVREDVYHLTGTAWLDNLAQDVRYAGRLLARQKLFAAMIVLTLSLGLGANSALVGIAYGVLLRPLPYSRPEELYRADIIVPERREQIPALPASVQTFLAWRKAATVFSGVAAATPWEASITGDSEPERLGGARVSANFFSLLGVPMALGRAFTADEERPGSSNVVVISHGLWRRRFGADPGTVGRRVNINGETFEIVGIAPPSLLVPIGGEMNPIIPFAPALDVWRPVAPTPRELRDESWDHGVLVRVADRGALETGRAQLEALLVDLMREQMPGTDTRPIVQLVPIREIYAGQVRLRLLLLLAASALLLLTACASIANMFLASVARRADEFATRVALGASRARLLAQTMTETTVLAIAGGAAAVLAARAGVRLLAASGPDEVRRLADAGAGWPLLVSALTVSVIVGIVCGMGPAWAASRVRPGLDLQHSARTAVGGRRASRARRLLVGVEIALATVLLASAGLLLRSFVNVMAADRGYTVDRVLAIDLSLFGQAYASADARAAFYRTLIERVAALPGASAAGAINNLPAVSGANGASRAIFLESDTDFDRTVLSRPIAMIRSVTSGYFAASGASLRAGRWLTERESSEVALVSESLAQRLWPGEPLSSIVGRRYRQTGVTGPLVSIVGVVADVLPAAVDAEPVPAVYRPYRQWASGPMTLLVRTAADPATLAASVRAEVARLDPNLPIASLRTMRDIVSSGVAPRRFQMTLTLLFALLALLLGAVAVYGVVSQSVAARTREIGLRLALGAARRDLLRAVWIHGMRPVVAGLIAGLASAIAIATVLRGLLFGIAPSDPVALGAVTAALLVTAGFACYLPARRAAAVDPAVALRIQ